MRACADNLKHLHLELGGKNPIIVLDDADLDLAVEGIVWSAFGTSGQRCTAASRVIVQDGVYGELQSRLVAAAEKLRLGPGWEQGVDVGPVINQGALEKIHSYTGIGKDEGAKLLTGGEIASGDGLGDGFFYRPTIFGDVQPGMRVAQEEIFGPTTALIRVRDVDEAIQVSNGIRYGLSSSIFTRDVNKAFRAMRDLQAGITYINAGTIGAEVHLPFGGTKDTGNGHREAGQAALVLLVVWWAWNYTAWVTNELDVESTAVRLLLIGLMLASLLMAVAIPKAFGHRALLFAGSYVAIQVGRHTFLTFVA